MGPTAEAYGTVRRYGEVAAATAALIGCVVTTATTPLIRHDYDAARERRRTFDPGMGRPMKGWIVLPLPHAKRWKEFAELALRYLAGGTT